MTACDCRSLADQVIVIQGLDHEQGEVDAPGEIAFQYRVADVPAPDGQLLALAFLEIAAANNGPAGFAFENSGAGLDLVAYFGKTKQPGKSAAILIKALNVQE